MTDEPAHVQQLGPFSLRAFPRRNWLVFSRHHAGATNSVGMSGDDLADAMALLRTGGDWLADYREDSR